MPAILNEQSTERGIRLLLQPPLIEAAVVLKGLLGVQCQQLYLRRAFQYVQQVCDPSADIVLRQYVQIAGPENEKEQLSVWRFDTPPCYLVDAQQLPGRGWFPLKNTHASNLQVKCCRPKKKAPA